MHSTFEREKIPQWLLLQGQVLASVGHFVHVAVHAHAITRISVRKLTFPDALQKPPMLKDKSYENPMCNPITNACATHKQTETEEETDKKHKSS